MTCKYIISSSFGKTYDTKKTCNKSLSYSGYFFTQWWVIFKRVWWQRIGFRFFNKVLTLMVYLELTKHQMVIIKGRILSLFRIIIFIKLPNLKMPLSLTYFFLKLYMAFKFVFGVVFKMIMLHSSCT